MQSQLPEAEVARLKALFDCRVLDTPPEELFDQTARLATYLCGTPIGLIGFIDATRLWFKSRVGWDYPEIPREDSICEQTIRRSDLLVIADAAADNRFSSGPMVTYAGIRFYTGAPLLTKEGHALGTLCVMDRLPRELPTRHQDALLTLAQLVSAQLETRHSTTLTAAASEHKRTEEALRDSQERFNGIISSTMDAVISVDDNRASLPEPAVQTVETILLVEDEPAVRTLMRMGLERQGYRILEAKDGAEAISICQQNPVVDLVVTDLLTAQMTGLELRDKAAVLRPSMKFLLISGYAKEVVGSPEQIAKFAGFLEKPFLPSELTRTVGEVLSRPVLKQQWSRIECPCGARQGLTQGG